MRIWPVVLLLLALAPARAQEGGPPTATVWTVEAAGDATAYGRVEDRGDGARVGVARARAGAGVAWSPGRAVRLSLELGAERSRHDWRRPERLGSPEVSLGEEPWDDLQALTASLGVQVFLGPRWSVVARLGASTGFEPGDVDVEDGASGSFGLSAGRRFDGGLTLGLGALALARLEDSPLVVPTLFVRWQPVEGVLVETAGPGLRVTARVDEGLDATLRAAFELRQWRLEDDRPRLAGAVVQDTRVVVAGGIVGRPWPFFSVRAEVGVYPYVEMRVRDRRGRDVRRLQGDPTGVVSLGLELEF